MRLRLSGDLTKPKGTTPPRYSRRPFCARLVWRMRSPMRSRSNSALCGAPHKVELESSLISERVIAGIMAAEIRGKHLGRPATQQRIIREIETLATSTDLSIRQI